jgi:hypothetical protein
MASLRGGARIGNLSKELLTGADERNVYGVVAVDGQQIVGATVLSG